jgi:capsular polysaccharide biosynthesis protein
LELRRYLTVIRSRLWLILLTTILAASVGYTLADTPDQYVARSTLYVGPRTVSLEPGAGEFTTDRLSALQIIVLTYSKMITSETIAQQAASDIGLERSASEVAEGISAIPEAGTQLLYVDVRDDDPATAQALANGVADAFIEAVRVFEPSGSEGAIPALPAYVFERAQLPAAPLPTDELQQMMLGAIFGLIASIGFAFLLDYLDLSIRTAADAERRLELPVLGVIPSLGDEMPAAQWHPTGTGG